MATDLAVVTAAVAAVIALVLLGIVIRQGRELRLLTGEIARLHSDIESQDQRIAELGDECSAAVRAFELVLEQEAPAVGADDDAGDTDRVAIITDISDRLGVAGDVELTRARIASVTLGGPLIKVAAFSHGVRHALDEEQRMRISYAVRKELRRQRKMRRRRRTRQSLSKEWAG